MLLPAIAVALAGIPLFRDLSDQQMGWYIGGAITFFALVGYFIAKLLRGPKDQLEKANPVMEPMQVEELMHGNPPIIVDLRTPAEFSGKRGHLRGALNIPFAQLKDRVEEIRGTTGNRPIILVDETDRLSHIVVPILRYEGFAWFYVMRGGMKAWNAKGLPVYR